MNIRITQYQPQHHRSVVDIITSIQQEEFGLPIRYEDQPDLINIPKFFDLFLVALHNNTPVGTIGGKILEDFAIIRKMFVVKDFRGKDFGIAQKLLDTLEYEMESREIKQIYLGTTELFKSAHKFYERNNYIEILQENLPSAFPIMKIDTKFYFKKIDKNKSIA